LEEHKAYYDGLIAHYAKQLEYVEMLLKNGQEFAKKHYKPEKPPKKPTTSLSECLKSLQKQFKKNKLEELHKYLISRKTTSMEDETISELESQSLDDYRKPVREILPFWNEVKLQFYARSWRSQLCLTHCSRRTLVRRL